MLTHHINNFKLRLKNIWKFTKQVFEKFIEDKAPKLGAALSFYTLFSLAPLLIIVIAIAGFVFGEDAARGELFYQIEGLVGSDGAQVIQTALKNTNQIESGIIAIIISLITLIISSTAVFVELQDSLNIIWKVKPKPGRNIFKGLIRDRMQSFALIMTTGFLLLVSLVISAFLSGLSNFINESFLTIPPFILQFINIVISLGVIFLLFTLIFKILPDVNIKWEDVWVGGLTTAILFVAGKYLIGLYLGNSSFSSTYGAAGSLVVLLLWTYYSAQILFLGAEFTYVYATRIGSGYEAENKFLIYETNPISKEKKEEK